MSHEKKKTKPTFLLKSRDPFNPAKIFGNLGGIRSKVLYHTDFLTYKEIQMGSGAKSYMRKGFLICKEMRKFFSIYEEAVSHI
jgi:hypothetical protein